MQGYQRRNFLYRFLATAGIAGLQSCTRSFGATSGGDSKSADIGKKPSNPVTESGAGDNDTAKLQTMLSEMGGTGNGKREVAIVGALRLDNAHPGEGGSGIAVRLPSDVLVKGGKLTTPNAQAYNLLYAENQSHIAVDGVSASAVRTNGNDRQAALTFEARDGISVYDVSARFCDLLGVSWGALVVAQDGNPASKIYGARLIGNYIDGSQNSGQNSADGLHLSGSVIGGVLTGNTIRQRADAGLAINGTPGNPGYGSAVVGNASIDNLVAVDFSGASYAIAVGNNGYSMQDRPASNPCLRAITDGSGKSCDHVLIASNLAIGNHASSSEYDAKVDSRGIKVDVTYAGNLLKTFFSNGVNVTLNHNIWEDGAHINISNGSDNVLIDQQTFKGAFDFTMPGNPGLSGAMRIAKPLWNRAIPTNFLPNYGIDGPFWLSPKRIDLDGDVTLISDTIFSTSSTVPVTVTNAFLMLRYPGILADVIGLADLATHSANLNVVDAENNVVASYQFAVVAGTGGMNIRCFATGPAKNGNAYAPKLPVGVYTFQLASTLGTATLKKLHAVIWQ